MARSLRNFPRFDTSGYVPPENMIPIPVPFGSLVGMDKTSPLPAMDPGKYRLVRNLIIRYGAYETRPGTDLLGDQADNELLYACDVILPDGSKYVVRWKTNGVEVYDNSGWVNASGDSFAGLATAPFAITGWNDRVLFTAGVGKVFELTFSGGFVVTELDESPEDVIHLTTFNGRVMASIKGTGIQWTVKNDHTDWTGLGSGYEDLLSAPGGRPDQQTAIIPVTDEVAYCVRSSSIWQVGNTGDFDSPFSFTLIYTHVGTKYVGTVAATRRGLCCVGDNGQVWFISPDVGAVDISSEVVPDFDVDPSYLEGMSASYDTKFDEYRVAIPTPNSLTAQKVLRYSFLNKGWTEDVYPFPIKSISYAQFTKSTTIDELVGTIDELVGSIDNLGVVIRNPGCIYATRGTSRLTIRDDVLMGSNTLRDVNFAGVRVASGFRLESGDLKITSAIKNQEFVEMILWYQSDKEVTLDFDYSYDGGVTWNLVSQIDAPATGIRPKAISVNRTVEREHLQVALSSTQAPAVKIIGASAMIREAGRTVDAR